LRSDQLRYKDSNFDYQVQSLAGCQLPHTALVAEAGFEPALYGV
jgi:hypothetical protein